MKLTYCDTASTILVQESAIVCGNFDRVAGTLYVEGCS